MILKYRSYQKEILDQDNLPFEDIRRNMQELDFINRWLGGHSISIAGLKKVIGNSSKILVCEIGCGGGDNIKALRRWCMKNNITAKFIGIDIKAECIDFARSRQPESEDIKWVVSDYCTVAFDEVPDVIFSSLFCHHFSDEVLVKQARWMKDNCKKGFFINDLQRSIVAYYSISYLTSMFSSSYLVKNDAPLSVARGFTAQELKSILKEANVAATISWKWAFRYLITFTHAR